MKYSKLSIGLINPKSPDNVNSVLRAAGNYRVNQVYYTGSRYDRALALNPDSPNISRKVGESVHLNNVGDLHDLHESEIKRVCIEFALGATPLPEYQHPKNACYIFGPEDGNIPQDIIDSADDVVYVPTVGSMNIAATVNVVLYDRLAKSTQLIYNNDLIKQNRDTNNNLIVKK